MPVKSRLSKARTHRVTEAAVEAYREARTTQVRRDTCDRPTGNCDATSISAACAACDKHRKASVVLHRALGLRPWEVSPLNVDGPEPPVWDSNSPYHESWPQAWALRQELEKRA